MNLRRNEGLLERIIRACLRLLGFSELLSVGHKGEVRFSDWTGAPTVGTVAVNLVPVWGAQSCVPPSKTLVWFGQGLLPRPSATAGLPVPFRRGVPWRPTVGRAPGTVWAGSGDPRRTSCMMIVAGLAAILLN